MLTWSEYQAAMPGRRAAGELVNEAELDWAHLAEDIESLGQSERSKLRNHIATNIEHLIKLQASPAVDPRNVWKLAIRRARLLPADAQSSQSDPGVFSKDNDLVTLQIEVSCQAAQPI